MFPVGAMATPKELRGSGLEVPRFVSLGSDKAFARSGPAQRYPVRWVYRKSGLPVEIIQEFDVWRKIRDVNGDESWVNKVLLSSKRSVIIKGDTAVPMYNDPTDTGRVIARLEPGVIAGLGRCEAETCRISTGGFNGWVKRKMLWGIYPQEEIN